MAFFSIRSVIGSALRDFWNNLGIMFKLGCISVTAIFVCDGMLRFALACLPPLQSPSYIPGYCAEYVHGIFFENYFLTDRLFGLETIRFSAGIAVPCFPESFSTASYSYLQLACFAALILCAVLVSIFLYVGSVKIGIAFARKQAVSLRMLLPDYATALSVVSAVMIMLITLYSITSMFTLLSAIVWGPFIFCIFPCSYWLVSVFFLFLAVVIDRSALGFHAFRISACLTQGSRLKIFLLYICILFLSFVIPVGLFLADILIYGLSSLTSGICILLMVKFFSIFHRFFVIFFALVYARLYVTLAAQKQHCLT